MLFRSDTIVAACRRHGVATGIHCSSVDHAQRMSERGFNFVTLLSDGAYLANAVKTDVAIMRTGAGAAGGAKGPY